MIGIFTTGLQAFKFKCIKETQNSKLEIVTTMPSIVQNYNYAIEIECSIKMLKILGPLMLDS